MEKVKLVWDLNLNIMIQIKQITPKGYAVTDLPEGADHDSFEITKWGALYYYTGVSPNHCGEEFKLPPGNWTLLGFAQDLTEEQWKQVVPCELMGGIGGVGMQWLYPDYEKSNCDGFELATPSGHSAVKAAGLFIENPLGSHPSTWKYIDIALHKLPDDIKTWDKFQQLLTNPLILIKE